MKKHCISTIVQLSTNTMWKRKLVLLFQQQQQQQQQLVQQQRCISTVVVQQQQQQQQQQQLQVRIQQKQVQVQQKVVQEQTNNTNKNDEYVVISQLVNNKKQQVNRIQQKRYYHVTKQQDIIPLLFVGTVIVLGQYTYRAINRMADEEDDYQYELQKYEELLIRNLQKQDDNNTNTNTSSSNLIQSTIGIDFGTIYTKMSSNKPNIHIMINPIGERYTFNGILYDNISSNDEMYDNCIGTGKVALERYYYDINSTSTSNSNYTSTGTIVLPYPMICSKLCNNDTSKTTNSVLLSKIVNDSISSTIKDVIERIRSIEEMSQQEDDQDQLHQHSNNKKLIRTVVTVPVSLLQYNNLYKHIFDSTTSNVGPITTVPEPIAAIWGAQMNNIIDSSSTSNSTNTTSKTTSTRRLIIDIGGLTTQLSIIDNDSIIIHSCTIPWGGESIIQVAVQQVLKDNNIITNSDNNNDTETIRVASSIQYHARLAVTELLSSTNNNKVQTNIHIPYLFPQNSNKQQQHLDTNLSRFVLQQATNDNIQNVLVPLLQSTTTNNTTNVVLSSHVPEPYDVTTLFTSIITSLFEHSNVLPTSINTILIIGGGSKYISLIDAIQNSFYTIMGPIPTVVSSATSTTSSPNSTCIVVPDISIRSELVAIGAASLLPSYEYSIIESKLIRRIDI